MAATGTPLSPSSILPTVLHVFVLMLCCHGYDPSVDTARRNTGSPAAGGVVVVAGGAGAGVAGVGHGAGNRNRGRSPNRSM